MPNFYTVILLHRFRMDQESRFDFTGGLVLRLIPEWIRADTFIKSLGYKYSSALDKVSYGFVFEYEATSPADTDSSWLTGQPKPIQETKYELAVLANLAIWLSRPSPVCFRFVFHGIQLNEIPTINRVDEHSTLLCHPNDIDAMPSSEDINLARQLYSVLVSIPRNSAIWTAVRATWAALQSNMEEVRYSLLWIALEALFGPEDAREITYRLAQRVAFFLGDDQSSCRQLFADTKTGYSFRSKVVHGRWKENTEGVALMARSEALVRMSLTRILQDSELTKHFLEKGRESFLDDLVFSRWGK